MQILLTLYLGDNCSETILTISAVAPARTGLQLMINARIYNSLSVSSDITLHRSSRQTVELVYLATKPFLLNITR